MKIKNPIIMKEIELTEKEKGALEVATLLIDAIYNTVCGTATEELSIEMESINCDGISKEKLYEVGEILEKILRADVLYTKSERGEK